MKKFISLLLSMVLVLGLAACGSSSDNKKADSSGNSKKSDGAEIALIIVASGTIDDKSYNQGAWEGIEAYAADNDLTYKYYQSTEDTVDSYLNAINLAVKGGAKVIVTPGYVFEPAIYQAQDKHPDVKFILLDGTPQDGTYTDYRTEDNVSAVLYAENEAGFLAGYAAVKDGYRKLGFMGGMAVPAVVKYGYGFAQGAEFAGKELGLGEGELELKYTYVGNYDASAENQTIAASWYQSGIEVIFSCGGPVGFSVMAAAEPENAAVIGVDSDQSADSETVITSAMKMLENSVYDILGMYSNDKFPGGETTTFSVKNNGVGLPVETSRFKTFTEDDYNEIYKRLADDEGGIASDLLSDTDVSAVTDIDLSIVKVELIGN